MAEQYEEPRTLSVSNINCSMAQTPFPVTVMRPFVPFYTVKRSEPFVAKSAWKGAINGVKALRRLKMNIGKTEKLRAELTVVTGHALGHMMVWNGDNFSMQGSSCHYNNVTVSNVVVTNTMIFSIVEKNSLSGKAGDDTDIYIWDLNTMELRFQLSQHEDRVTSIVVDPENEYRFFSSSADKAIFMWDLKQNEALPVLRMLGHASVVSRLLISGDTLYSGSADGVVKVWNLAKNGKCATTIDAHQGGITYMEWHNMYDPDYQRGSFITACSSGVVRYYNVSEGTELQMQWSNKAHKALITDVAVDGPIVASSSATDGVTFYHQETKKNSKYVTGEAGVRQLAIDATRKLVLAGYDNGLLVLLNYLDLYQGADGGDGISVFASLQPHLGSISSILLERAQNGQWERVITASQDHSIFVMDFDTTRDARNFAGYGHKYVCQIDETGTVVAPFETGALLWDPVEMHRKVGPQKTIEGHASRVNAVRYSFEYKKLISGSEDGIIRTSNVRLFSEESLASEELVEPAAEIATGMSVRCISKPVHFLVAVGLQKNSQMSKAGGVSIISINQGVRIGEMISTFLFPVNIEILAWEQGADKILQFSCIVQLRNGEVNIFHGNEEGKFTPMRSLMREQIPYSLEREAEAAVPMPVALKSRLNFSYTPPRIECLAVESNRVFRSFDFAEAEGTSTNFFTVNTTSDIVEIQPILQGQQFAAIAMADSTTVVVSNKGERLFEIGYDGACVDIVQEEFKPARRRRTFVKSDAGTLFQQVTNPPCTALAVSIEHRYLAIGYGDGLVQLWDLTSKRVCRRVYAHSTAIQKILPLSNPNRIATTSAAGNLRFDTIYSRNIRERNGTPPPEMVMQ